ncbi:four helix bundle protein [Chryseobacterium lathyri]|uniref:Four helix bundle protein n=1 Tax=Chryseobacterium lathyri TaxID=395933 RepID=A0ABT9SGG0_9FLAO|nr:four helix bundle protein [Chryseobacterium lathyri]MDP9958503.1 four helix bundle protein [Chryseobacterium lathyri]MDQ0066538.1 four helix bundle protein [Chryseobacterium lathyri]
MNADNNYNQVFSKRTKSLTITIINELSEIPYSDKISNIRKQIFRSASSTASNYRAMCRGRSLKEKYSKICIVVEEADETLFWRELIDELNLLETEKINSLLREADEIVKSTSSYKKKLGEDLKRSNNQL